MITFRNKINNILKRKKNRFTVREIIDYFKQDGIFAILFIITLPTSIPTPAHAFGSSTMIGGVITLLLSFQLLLGYDTAYLPEFILKKKVNISSFRKIYRSRIDKFLIKMENIFKKRNKNAFCSIMLKFSALVMMFNSILMFIPLIMTNWLPSTTVTFISFSYLFNDGFMFVTSLLLSTLIFLFYIVAFVYIFSYVKKNKKNVYKFLKKKKKEIF